MSQVPSSPGLDAESLVHVKVKLDDCIGSHQCEGPRNAELPMRLVDLKAWPESPERIRLVVTDEVLAVSHQTIDYVVLSYCWGTTTAFTTTPATLSSRLKGFNIAGMPRTLRDTVQVARNIGYRYLWIDALCILQGSRQDTVAAADWRYEAARMHWIYGNASLCIVAAGASNSDQGLMHKDPRVIADDEIAEWVGKGKIPIGCEPISSRAWCFQEWLLSNRLLVFASTGVYYTCDQYVLDTSDPDYGFRFPRSLQEVAAMEDRGNRRYDSWQTMAMNFCGRSMTEPSDKLPALSGMAQRYASLMGWQPGDYLAGLWRRSLIGDLLWVREEGISSISATPDPTKTGRQYGRAPSWSWASMDGSIMYLSLPGGYAPDIVCIQSCETVKPGVEDDPFGQVVSGHLDIVCPYMTLWARPMVQETGELYFQLFDAEGGFVSLLTVDDPAEMDASQTNVSTTPQFQRDDSSHRNEGIMVHCLGLMVEQSPQRRDGKIRWAGMAVRPLIGNSYARVGNFWIAGFKIVEQSRFLIV
ncbi:HET domain-containing protein [Diaporthe amygdali]|uniref:HET domain-containing protein n=1 Tax=Phomopsis amygdali TaxID=1214568 RepID=UPI0022FEE9A6|nr:HET domain-containing protein [Diaporthe amygdali]KAJ0109704.1 HET domain-containing protein [Diaporthe amygdali]